MTSRGGSKTCHAIIIIGLFFFLAFIPAVASAAEHFLPPPVFTNKAADFLINLKIDGVAAQPGDEVAFFDPQGVLCGHAVVGAYPSFRVPVYGDDDATPAVDEGAMSGDVLTIKVWNAVAGIELSGSSLILSPGVIPGVAPSAVPPVWGDDRASYALNIDTATHFPKPPGSTFVSNYIGSLAINGQPANIGDEIAVFNRTGVLCGSTRISVSGAFGIIEVYGDDPATTVDEGAAEGEILSFKVWDRAAGVEYGPNDLTFGSGTPLGSDHFAPSGLPPIWSKDKGYILNIDVLTLDKGDIDGNGRVDLADAVLALQVLSALPHAAVNVYKQADVNGDMKVGLEEAIYVLQKLAVLR